ncbi:uncharacterized protein [Eulemur rufifrons]|uniref:uncharacterized protein n=1 Tax=Eulemur rufifrons TaxID=859984 RepID=UPI003741F3FC
MILSTAASLWALERAGSRGPPCTSGLQRFACAGTAAAPSLSPRCANVCVRCYAGQEGGDRGGGGGSVYCPSRCVNVRKPELQRGRRRRPLRQRQRPGRLLWRLEWLAFAECEKDKAPLRPCHVRTPRVAWPPSRLAPPGFGPACCSLRGLARRQRRRSGAASASSFLLVSLRARPGRRGCRASSLRAAGGAASSAGSAGRPLRVSAMGSGGRRG